MFITNFNIFIMNLRHLKIYTTLLFFSCVNLLVAQYTFSGQLNDDNGEALIGATVKITDLSLGTSTDLEGNFTISNI